MKMNTLKLFMIRHGNEIRNLHVRRFAKQFNLTSNTFKFSTSTILTKTTLNTPKLHGQTRWCSSNANSDDRDRNSPVVKLPPLMNFPEIVWPSLIKSIRNFILATFIVRPYFDHDFNLPDFIGGAKQALEVVSNRLSQGDTKALDGLVEGEVIPKLASSVSLMSLMQRELIGINKEDIYFSFPYQIGIIFNDEEGTDQKRFVEITMVFHTLRGLSAMREKGEEPPLNMGMLPEYQKRISICNYRFIREYTKGVEGEWTINLLNHFRPTDSLPNDQ